MTPERACRPPGAVIRARDLGVVYQGGSIALRGVDLELAEGELTVLVGPSGAGKSTLLRCLNGTIRPTTGTVLVGGTSPSEASGRELRSLRREIALIPQQFNLVRRSSVVANVLAGRLGHVGLLRGLLGLFPAESWGIAMRSLGEVDLGDRHRRRVDTLSGGEQQRVAIARALTQEPSVILADEPVASLDHGLATTVMEILGRINRERSITVLVALHDLRLAADFADRIIALDRGSVVYDGGRGRMTFEDLRELTGHRARV